MANNEEPLVIYKDQLGPSISDTLYIDKRPYDLSSATVHFMMRLLDSDAIKVDDVALLLDQTNFKGGIRYDWSTGDTDTPGRYVFWWRINISGRPTDTEEHRLDIRDHAPGEEATVGAIADRTTDYLPGSLTAMRKSEQYGDESLQRTINVVKFRLTATALPAYLEATTYTPPVIDYLAMWTALEVIPHAVDFYNDKSSTVTTTGTNESLTFPDRAKTLWDIYGRLKDKLGGKILVEDDGVWTVGSASALNGGPVITHDSTNKVTLDPTVVGAAMAQWTDPSLVYSIPYTTWS
jgi:hypothetical protein